MISRLGGIEWRTAAVWRWCGMVSTDRTDIGRAPEMIWLAHRYVGSIGLLSGMQRNSHLLKAGRVLICGGAIEASTSASAKSSMDGLDRRLRPHFQGEIAACDTLMPACQARAESSTPRAESRAHSKSKLLHYTSHPRTAVVGSGGYDPGITRNRSLERRTVADERSSSIALGLCSGWPPLGQAGEQVRIVAIRRDSQIGAEFDAWSPAPANENPAPPPQTRRYVLDTASFRTASGTSSRITPSGRIGAGSADGFTTGMNGRARRKDQQAGAAGTASTEAAGEQPALLVPGAVHTQLEKLR